MKQKISDSRRAFALRSAQRPPELDAAVDRFLATVCDRSRRYILELLAVPREGAGSNGYERQSGEIARTLGLSRSTTSEHLRQLADENLVIARREGNVTWYRLGNHALVRAFQDLMQGLDTHYGKPA